MITNRTSKCYLILKKERYLSFFKNNVKSLPLSIKVIAFYHSIKKRCIAINSNTSF
ncbi:hypothetical protein FM106_21130 [Brachybacterium faecium]|nr:hypothetical protein FM106_21130 [Brachybacterium faecium]